MKVQDDLASKNFPLYALKLQTLLINLIHFLTAVAEPWASASFAPILAIAQEPQLDQSATHIHNLFPRNSPWPYTSIYFQNLLYTSTDLVWYDR